MRCHRCYSFKLLQLDKKLSQDNDVFRCQECGFIFSPQTQTQTQTQTQASSGDSSNYPEAAPAPSENR